MKKFSGDPSGERRLGRYYWQWSVFGLALFLAVTAILLLVWLAHSLWSLSSLNVSAAEENGSQNRQVDDGGFFGPFNPTLVSESLTRIALLRATPTPPVLIPTIQQLPDSTVTSILTPVSLLTNTSVATTQATATRTTALINPSGTPTPTASGSVTTFPTPRPTATATVGNISNSSPTPATGPPAPTVPVASTPTPVGTIVGTPPAPTAPAASATPTPVGTIVSTPPALPTNTAVPPLPTSTSAPTSTPMPPPTSTPGPAPTSTPMPPTSTPIPPPTNTPVPPPTSTSPPPPTSTPVPPPTSTPIPPPTHTPTPEPPPPPVPVQPILECVANNGNGSYTAHFGYFNGNATPKNIPVSESNRFIPPPHNRGQPTDFQPGLISFAFSVAFDGNPLHWQLDGGSVTARSDSAACP